MTDVRNCLFPHDYSSFHDFWGNFQVGNTTKSIYSDRYLTAPGTPQGIATLTSEPHSPWYTIGGLGWQCSRMASMAQDYNSTSSSGLVLHINTEPTGRAPLITLTGNTTSGNWFFDLTPGFYVEDFSIPMSFSVKNGSYYACTDDAGEIGVYFRLNTTTTPSDCEDILLYPRLTGPNGKEKV